MDWVGNQVHDASVSHDLVFSAVLLLSEGEQGEYGVTELVWGGICGS